MTRSPHTSAYQRRVRGDAAPWDVTGYMLAGVLNTLRSMSWQLGGDEKAPKPKPYLPPGVDRPEEKSKHRLGDRMTIEEMDARMARYLPHE